MSLLHRAVATEGLHPTVFSKTLFAVLGWFGFDVSVEIQKPTIGGGAGGPVPWFDEAPSTIVITIRFKDRVIKRTFQVYLSYPVKVFAALKGAVSVIAEFTKLSINKISTTAVFVESKPVEKNVDVKQKDISFNIRRKR